MTSDLEKIWLTAQAILEKKLKGPSFQTWIKPTKLIQISSTQAILGVKNEFSKNFLQSTYFTIIESAIESALNKKLKLEIVVKSDLTLDEFFPSIASLNETKSNLNPEPATKINSSNNNGYLDHTFKYRGNLNPSYTFENFVVGSGNQFCHAAALAVSESLNTDYNPFFIYSSVGLGKTHLINAIANYSLDQNSSCNIKYLSSEAFTNELISSIRTDGMNRFREKYRNVDVLMIDDVQFLEGKEATQEEFFHTFNTLKDSGKQIILTSDRPPSSLTSLTDRLRSRFEGGLIADIKIPDLETRIAILILKSLLLKINLSCEIAEYIATIYSNNIRELEGALKRVHAYLTFAQEEFNLKNVQRVLGKVDTPKLSPENIIKIISSFYNISREDLLGNNRASHLTQPRHIAMYVLHEIYGLSFPSIGEIFSGRTHSAAIYSYKQIKKKMNLDSNLKEEITNLRGIIEKKQN